jgi:hypothetical protein
MKKLLLTLALVTSAALVHGQGSIAFLNPPTVLFKNEGTTVNVPVDVNGGLNYGIFIGATAASLSDQAAAPLATGSTTAAGRMTGVPAVYLLEGTQPGQIVFAQVRAWDKTFGADWRAASTHNGSYYGETDIRQLEALGPASGPGTVIWQGATGTSANRFFAMQIHLVPEPSTIALAVLGLGSLLLFRRRK